mmetsp:Transcript_4390/g.12982  ORF Transcript_4390/g.12982 Transcript_4390/m.12982 type:complete len:128 (-) Transcript_4390:1358-1741(-)
MMNDWRTSRMIEDYMNFTSDLMMPHVTYGQYGSKPAKSEFHLERPTLLGAVISPVRRPLAFETWSPREIVTFEGALAVHGKCFHTVQQFIKTKTTKEVIEFYYIWKMSSHYKAWKQNFVPDISDPEY